MLGEAGSEAALDEGVAFFKSKGRARNPLPEDSTKPKKEEEKEDRLEKLMTGMGELMVKQQIAAVERFAKLLSGHEADDKRRRKAPGGSTSSSSAGAVSLSSHGGGFNRGGGAAAVSRADVARRR